MRRTWVAVLASVFWLACGGDDIANPPDGTDAAGGRGGSAGTGGAARDGASDRATVTGGSSGAGVGGSSVTRDASEASVEDGDATVRVDVVSETAPDTGSGGGPADARPEGGGNDGGTPDGATLDGPADGPADVSLGGDAAADVVAVDAGSGDEPGCSGPNDCPTPANECLRAACVDGGCGTTPVTLGTAVAAQVPGDCKRKVCNGSGGTQDQNDDSDVADDAKVCTLDGCNNGSPTHTPQTGMLCGTSGVCSNLGECVGCNVAADCPGIDDFCKIRKCDAGTCSFTYTNPGTALPSDQQTAGDCKTKACNASGGIEEAPAPGDVLSDGNACTKDECNGTTPSHPPENAGTPCPGNHKCDGAGACVECLAPADCVNPAAFPCVIATCSNDHHCGTANADATTNCGQGPSCASGLGHLQDKCNGSGTCVPGASPLCSPFVCGANACNTSCSDDNGCAATFVCDTGLTSCIPTGTPKCTDYCATIQSACTGVNQEYPSPAECLHSCAGLPRDAAMSGNAMGCRLTHAGLAVGDPVTHCPHAGPAGDGVCGANCESFCSLATTTCTGANQQFTVGPDCMTACASFSMTPARYTTTTVTGNTFPCRMFHLTLATVDPGTHCPHIAVSSAVCQ